MQRGLIRVDADELTYPLHIMLRYELEKQLLSGELAVRDLPEAWNAGMEQRLGIRPTNDADGCLQDIHWAVGSFGYFPSYALGAVIAAQLYETLRTDVPELDEQLPKGEFSGLLGWLRTHVHGLGAKVPVQDLLKERDRQTAVRGVIHTLCRVEVPGERAKRARPPEITPQRLILLLP